MELNKTWHKWSPDDILVLCTGWRNNVPAYVIAARLNRPRGAVQTKASELKLRRPGKWRSLGYTVLQCAEGDF